MKTLVVSATDFEVRQALLAGLPNVDFLITGVGMVNTAYMLGKKLATQQYKQVINAGVCGCFNRDYPLGTVFNITADTFADLGADDNGTFIDMFGLGLMDKDAAPFTNGWIVSPHSVTLSGDEVVEGVKAITVNTVSGSQDRIDKLVSKYKPVAESMEGAAVAYVCAMENMPYLQLRAASNYVEPRNRENWQMALAINNLNKVLIDFLK